MLLKPCGATRGSTKGKAVFYHKSCFLFESYREGMGHRPEHGLDCCGWRGVCSASIHWSVWKELVETKPPAPLQGSSFGGCVGGRSEHICSWETCLWPNRGLWLPPAVETQVFLKKKKFQGLLWLAGNISVSRLQKQDQVLGDSEAGDGWTGGWGGGLGLWRAAARLWLCQMALLDGHLFRGVVVPALAITSPNLPGHKTHQILAQAALLLV